MSIENQLLNKLESCIECLGDEFQEKADDYFWLENDLTCKLYNYLWAEPIMTHQFEHKLGGGKVPLAHTEHHKIDLNLYSPETAVYAIRDYANNKHWWDDKAPILAGVEIKYLASDDPWEKYYYKPIEKLIEMEQVDYGYLLIFAIVQVLKRGIIRDYRDLYEEQVSVLRNKWGSLWSSSNIRIYCVPGDNSKQMKPEWIPRKSKC